MKAADIISAAFVLLQIVKLYCDKDKNIYEVKIKGSATCSISIHIDLRLGELRWQVMD